MKALSRVLCIALAILLLAGELPAIEAHAATTAGEAIVDNSNGTVRITFTADADATVLILVEVPAENLAANSNEAAKYWYKLTTGINEVDIPLTKGEGKYKIRICKTLSNGKATVLATKEVELGSASKETVFEVANFVVDYEVDDKFIKKAATLTKSCKKDLAKIKKIYNYIIKNYAYDYELLDKKAATQYYNPNNIETYTRQLGICYDISSLMAAMLRSVGVEARVVTGHTPNVSVYHAWNQVYDSNKKKWYTIDATYDMCLYSTGSKKKYTMIKKDSEYCDITYYY